MLVYSFGKAYKEMKGETIQKSFQSSGFLLFIIKMGAECKYIYIAIKIKPAKSYKG